jgi:hypothetical protein
MLSNELFVLLLGFALSLVVFWACKRLPEERWQFLASVPIIKDSNGHWVGLNFTYYGLLCECAGFRRGFADCPHGLFTRSSGRHAFTYMCRPNTMPAGGAVDRQAGGGQTMHFYDRRSLFRRHFYSTRDSGALQQPIRKF